MTSSLSPGLGMLTIYRSSSVMSSKAELAIEELIIEGGPRSDARHDEYLHYRHPLSHKSRA